MQSDGFDDALLPLPCAADTQVHLIRHGESVGNRDGLLQGQADLPLTDLGHEQARRLARRLVHYDFSLIYSSDLSRAVQTSAYLGESLHLSINLDQRLREIDVGEWSGLSDAQIAARFPAQWQRWQERDPRVARGDGESYVVAQGRIVTAITSIAARHPGAQVAVVCHGGVIRAYLAHLLRLDLREIWQFSIGNTGICRVRPFAPSLSGDPSHLGRIDAINDLAHLELTLISTVSDRYIAGTTRRYRKDRKDSKA
jgi:probable phosphoglycerate mutase